MAPSSDLMRSCLVTGADGFIGRHLVRALRRRQIDVIATGRKEWDIVAGDPPKRRVDHVFHLAAAGGVLESWQELARFHLVNVHGTIRVLEYARHCSASMTYISAYCYGIPSRQPISEAEPPKPNNPYAFTKFMGEEGCRFFHKQFGIPLTILRPFNVYGPGQSDNFLIPRILAQAQDHSVEMVEVMDLAPRRDFVYVDDVVDALLLTVPQKGYELYNVGLGRSYSVEEVIITVLHTLNSRKPCRSANSPRANEIPEVVADISAISQERHWSPQVSLAEGIRRICMQGPQS
jgi:nucleoside-diphosphate-sugar epimerase